MSRLIAAHRIASHDTLACATLGRRAGDLCSRWLLRKRDTNQANASGVTSHGADRRTMGMPAEPIAVRVRLCFPFPLLEQSLERVPRFGLHSNCLRTLRSDWMSVPRTNSRRRPLRCLMALQTCQDNAATDLATIGELQPQTICCSTIGLRWRPNEPASYIRNFDCAAIISAVSLVLH